MLEEAAQHARVLRGGELVDHGLETLALPHVPSAWGRIDGPFWRGCRQPQLCANGGKVLVPMLAQAEDELLNESAGLIVGSCHPASSGRRAPNAAMLIPMLAAAAESDGPRDGPRSSP